MEQAEEMRVCKRCKAAKPRAEFVSRTPQHLGLQANCVECRDRDKAPLSPEGEQRRAVRAQRATERLEALRTARLEAAHLEREQRLAEEQQRYDRWAAPLLAAGFSAEDVRDIYHAETDIRMSGRPWDDVRRLFLKLDPPYTGMPRTKNGHRKKGHHIGLRRQRFDEQGGQCYYCHHAVRSPDEPYNGTAEYQRARNAYWAQRRSGSDDELLREFYRLDKQYGATIGRRPQLDHRIPLSRGGTDEPANLVLACERCNQAKLVRTPEEFAAMPDDPISQLAAPLGAIAYLIEMESERGYIACQREH